MNDVSWNRASAATPFLGDLARRGVILDNVYTLPVCTPSRAALMTGTYPFKLGLQVGTSSFPSCTEKYYTMDHILQRGFGKHIPDGIPVSVPLLPRYLQEVGYRTLGLGKWHLGLCSDL